MSTSPAFNQPRHLEDWFGALGLDLPFKQYPEECRAAYGNARQLSNALDVARAGSGLHPAILACGS